ETYQLTDCVAKEPIDFGGGFFGAPDDDDANADGDLDHTAADDLTIEGNGATIENTCLYDRVIDNLDPDSRLILDDLTVTGGVGAPGEGGNIFSLGGATLTSVVVSDSLEDVGSQQGALVVGDSSIFGSGNLLTMTDSTFIGNEQSGVRVAMADAVITDSGFFDNGRNGVSISFGELQISGTQLIDNGNHGVSGIDGAIFAVDLTAGGNGGYGLRNTGNAENGQPLDVTDSIVIANLTGGLRCSYCTDLNVAGSRIELNDGTGVSMVTNVDDPTMTIVDSEIVDNTGAPGGGFGPEAGGVQMDAEAGPTPTVTIERSTIAGNSSAPGAPGGGVRLVSAGLALSNSTITNNASSADGGGISATGTVPVELSVVTLVENTASAGAANLDVDAGVTTTASVIALGTGGPNCAIGGAVTSLGGNQADDVSCGLTGAGDVAPAPNPMLEPLADNGGPTPTRLPQSGSPLLGAVTGPTCSGAADDQRGVTRPQGPACEPGAVEVDETPMAMLVASRTNLTSQDRALRTHLEDRGYAVTAVDDDDLTPVVIASMDDADLVLVSSSVVPSKVGALLNGVTTPIVTNEAYHFDDLGIATGSGETASTKNVVVVDPTSGFSGFVGVLKQARPLSSGDPVPTADVVAVAPQNDRPVAFTVAAGAMLADATPAAGARGAFFFSFAAPKVARADAFAILDHVLDEVGAP
ncbi:MAG: right-handed parallel beta-helix repeat-containing protein, partial [Actinomycetota bacterium]